MYGWFVSFASVVVLEPCDATKKRDDGSSGARYRTGDAEGYV